MDVGNFTEGAVDFAVRAPVPIAVSTAPFMGIDLPFFIQIGTAIYVVLIVVDKGWTLWKRWKDKDKNDTSE